MSAPFFAHVGFGNILCANRVLGVVVPGTKTTKRYVENARQRGNLIDVSKGKTVKSIILMDEGSVVLSHISPDTLKFRLSNLNRPESFRAKVKLNINEEEDEQEEEMLEDEPDPEEEDDEEEDEDGED